MRQCLRLWYRHYLHCWRAVAVAFNVVVAVGAFLAPISGREVLLIALLASTAITDLLWKRIPNAILLSAFAWAFALPGEAIEQKLLGTGAALGAMLALYFTFGGGEGDVKLLAVLGSILGPWMALDVLQRGFILAAAAAIAVIAFRALLRRRPLMTATLPMAPFFALSVLQGYLS